MHNCTRSYLSIITHMTENIRTRDLWRKESNVLVHRTAAQSLGFIGWSSLYETGQDGNKQGFKRTLFNKTR